MDAARGGHAGWEEIEQLNFTTGVRGSINKSAFSKSLEIPCASEQSQSDPGKTGPQSPGDARNSIEILQSANIWPCARRPVGGASRRLMQRTKAQAREQVYRQLSTLVSGAAGSEAGVSEDAEADYGYPVDHVTNVAGLL